MKNSFDDELNFYIFASLIYYERVFSFIYFNHMFNMFFLRIILYNNMHTPLKYYTRGIN